MLKVISTYKKISNITKDYSKIFYRIEKLTKNIKSKGSEHEVKVLTSLLSEYYLTGMHDLSKAQLKKEVDNFEELFLNHGRPFTIQNSVFNLYNKPELIKKELDKVRYSIAQNFFKEGCALISNFDELYPEQFTDLHEPHLFEGIFNKSKKLPDYLDKFLYDELNAKYECNFERVKVGINADRDEVISYLGAYFPRSYIEIKNITDNLLCQSVFYKNFTTKKKIKILDVGSGTGGSLIGALDALIKRNGITRNIEITSIDGNDCALNFQKIILEEFKKKRCNEMSMKLIHKRFPKENTFFKTCLKGELNDINKEFDIIITSKFLSEFYNRDYYGAKGIYGIFAETAVEHLSSDGIIIINDLTTKDNEYEWTPYIINMELNKFITSSNSFGYILPLSCARWCSLCSNPEKCYSQLKLKLSHSHKEKDISKVTFKVIARKSLCREILACVSMNNQYRINYANDIKVCKNGEIIKIPKNHSPYAFFI